MPGIGGTLLSPIAIAAWAALDPRRHARASSLAGWAAAALSSLGPASSERRLLETIENLFGPELGFTLHASGRETTACSPGGCVALAATAWGAPLAPPSTRLLRTCVDRAASWGVTFNGQALGIADARAGSARRAATIALDQLATRAETAALAAALFDPSAIERALAEAVDASDAHAGDVQRALREGVDRSLDALRRELPFDAGVLVLFRLLFVLFAEGRSLVPMWHEVYRDHYSLDALSSPRLLREPQGTWAALEAGRRLLAEGCRAGTLEVPAFNGRLFAPAGARRWARTAALDSTLDRPAADALAALVSYRPARGGARRVDYAELDVEELGSIYERVLDCDPSSDGRARKESGSFYTPRSLTTFLVRRTLAPLIEGASSDRILAIRVVDPAMGSGAFLVAALQYLSDALERALVREGALPEADIDDRERRDLRRIVAQRCLYGVDVNPTAVMLAKLSVWLATLCPGKPLSFLDHRLRCGNSLIGIEPARANRPPGESALTGRLPLFETAEYLKAAESGAGDAVRIALMREDTLEEVRAKERAFTSPARRDLHAWGIISDIWCAWWLLPSRRRADAREFRAMADALLRRSRVLAKHNLDRRVRDAAAARESHGFFHWPLEFPDAFPGGFDAVIGNPPWEMLRAEGGSADRGGVKTFARRAGVFSLAGGGHVNLYQLFVERALQITRVGGRLGLVVPWGLMTDEGSAPLRGRLFDGTAIDTFVRFDNNRAIFQAHRSLRFAAVTATAGGSTESLDIARSPDAASLDDLPDSGPPPGSAAVTQAGLRAIGGRTRRVPDVDGPQTLAVALQLATMHRGLGDPEGWGASFGRELNLTDDRGAFVAAARGTLPVLEGKHVHPYRVDRTHARHHIRRAAACRLLPDRPFDRPRLAYRDVTAPTNRQTLIAAIVPAGCVTGHSLFCLRNAGWDPAAERALCAILNSAVANFLIRLFVSAHVTTALMAWLPVPDRARATAALGHVTAASRDVDSLVAALYGLEPGALAALSTRPPAV